MTKKIKQTRYKRIIKRLWYFYTGLVTFVILMFCLSALGVFGYMPDLDELENPKSYLATEIFSSDGQLLGTYYRENRSNTRYEEISENLINALIATEDVRYIKHSGVDFKAIVRMVWGVVTFQSKGGGSTITQQLAKNLFPRERKSKIGLVTMKFKEWVVAAKLERRFTKKEILTHYFNTVPFGGNSYGIKIATKTYFNKTPAEVNSQEAALLIGMLKGPTRYHPVRNPENALGRRNTVISQMRKYGTLTQEEADSIKEIPIDISAYKPLDHTAGLAPYFREYLREFLRDWLKEYNKANNTNIDLYKDGLKIYTTINARMQQHAESAVNEHLGNYLQEEFFKHWEGRKNAPFFRLSNEQITHLMTQAMKRSDRYIKMKNAGYSKKSIEKQFNTPVPMTVFSWDGPIDTVMTPMDSIRYCKHFLHTGIMSVEPQTGYVRAYVGGINFNFFKFDHVVKSKRQVGSTFKPFVYAMAMQEGESPCTMVPNIPVTIEFDGKTWTPKNSGSYKNGQMVNYKEALAHSINQVTTLVMKKYGAAAVVKFVKDLGVESEIPAVPSICLGTPDLSVYEMTGAHAAFANKGVYVKPTFITRIEDRQGNILATFIPERREVMSEQTAYLMIELMKGVVQYGTSTRIGYKYGIRNPVAGKTGTTDNNSDGWFIGSTPDLVTGVWVGAEDRSVHFRSTALGQGATMALPIWAIYMNKLYNDPAIKISTSDFDKPEQPIDIITDCDEYNRINVDRHRINPINPESLINSLNGY